eukprot:GHVU01105583.1.p1 GENE.GHVU01105583.1~~GHVU01105583.1.p1  ORF type:complete len:107 (+),score=1.29 GHVU01105583.1:286-606(+)
MDEWMNGWVMIWEDPHCGILYIIVIVSIDHHSPRRRLTLCLPLSPPPLAPPSLPSKGSPDPWSPTMGLAPHLRTIINYTITITQRTYTRERLLVATQHTRTAQHGG